MKILIFAELYYPDVMGGGEYSTKQMTEGLVKKGHEVIVYCLGNKTCEEVIGGVQVKREYVKDLSEFYLSAAKNHDVKNPLSSIDKILRKWPDLYFNPKWYKKYKTIISKEEPDLVHTVSPMSYLGRVNLWKAAYDLKIPVSHVCRSPRLLELKFFGGKLNNYNIQKNAKASEYLTALAAPSKFMLECHNKANIRGQRFNEVIYNAVDFEKIPASVEMIEKKENMVLYAGELKKEKGILTLVNAINGLSGIKLLLIGSGELVEKIKNNDNVEIIHWMERVALYAYMKKTKAVILPSEWDEAFGRVLIESINNGTIGIGSDRGGIPEVLDFDKKYIFHTGDAEGLRSRIARVINLTSSEYKEEIDRQQNITSDFTDEKYVANWEKFFLQQLK